MLSLPDKFPWWIFWLSFAAGAVCQGIVFLVWFWYIIP